MDENTLIQLAKKGELDAFNQLILMYQDMAFNVAYRIMNDEAQAADATQDAVISMYRRFDTYRGGSFKAWFMRIVTNACYDALRWQKRRPTIALEPETDDGERIESPYWLEDNEAKPDEELEKKELEAAIQHCINALPNKFKTVFLLIDVNGDDYETVAQSIQRPVGTVKSRLSRARQRMQKCLQGFGELLPDIFRLNAKNDDEQVTEPIP